MKIPLFVKILLLLVPITMAFLLVNLLVIGPKAKRLKSAKEELNRLQLEINRHKNQLADFQPLSTLEIKEIRQTKEELLLVSKSLKTVRDVYDKITSNAVQCGISDLSIDPSYRPLQEEEILGLEAKLGLDQHRSYIKLSFHCELKSLGCFLKGLTGGENYLIIESLTIKRELPKPSAEIVLKVFTKG